MADLCSVCITGRLTADCLVKDIPSGKVCEFTVACNGYKEGETVFFKVSLFGKSIEGVHRYLNKAQGVAVQGQLKLNKWTGSDGQAHEQVCITTTSVVLLASPHTSASQQAEEMRPDLKYDILPEEVQF